MFDNRSWSPAFELKCVGFQRQGAHHAGRQYAFIVECACIAVYGNGHLHTSTVLRGAPPVTPQTAVQGNCSKPVPSAYSRRVTATCSHACSTRMTCVVRVLHSWLQVNPSDNATRTDLLVSNFYVEGARSGPDEQEPTLIQLNWARVWLANLTLAGDGYRGRGIAAPTSQVYAQGAPPLLATAVPVCYRSTS
jgi:hypothetical protein